MSLVLKEKFLEIGIELDKFQIDQFEDYYQLLTEWNQFMNLTAIKEYGEVLEKHFIDSIALKNAISINSISSLIDIGTGAGFPGIPLKIVYPHLKVSLIDSLNKRVKFLNTVIKKLELKEIEALHGRAEDYARKEAYREKYDICVSRAVANLSTLSEYCIPYVKMGGYFISYKSGQIDVEVEEAKNAVKKQGGSIEEVIKFRLPDTDIDRSFIKIKKVDKTANKYPRKAGLPSKEPL